MSLGPRKMLVYSPITADTPTRALTAALCSWYPMCPDRCSNTESVGTWACPGFLYSSSHILL